MQISSLIILFFILIVILAILIFFLLKVVKKKKFQKEREKNKAKKKTKAVTLEDLRDKMKDKNLSSKELKDILDAVLQEYGIIEDFTIYMDIIVRMTRHKATNKDIIIAFDKELSRLNPKFAVTISNSVTNGLSLR